MPDGRLLLQDRAQTILPEEEEVNPLLWVFEMRVGTHFERPMQAIMSCGHFIRMRSAEIWGSALLGKLDPARPDNCLYAHAPALVQVWRPYIPVPQYGTVHPPAQQTLTITTLVGSQGSNLQQGLWNQQQQQGLWHNLLGIDTRTP